MCISWVMNTFQTAEMPEFYADGDYDLSGLAVGIVKKDSVIDGRTLRLEMSLLACHPAVFILMVSL